MSDEWRDIPGYEGLYRASSDGRIYGIKRGKELKKVFDSSQGRYVVTLGKDGGQKKYNVAWLVASAFLGERPEGGEVHHKNCDPADDRADNLEYLTKYKHWRAHLELKYTKGKATAPVVCDAFTGDALEELWGIFFKYGGESEIYRSAYRSAKRRTQTKSIYKGLSKGKGRRKWQVQLNCGGKKMTIGQFESEIEAARAYDKAARLHHGVFASTNFDD